MRSAVLLRRTPCLQKLRTPDPSGVRRLSASAAMASVAAQQPVVLSYNRLLPAKLLRRYKRFLGDVELEGQAIPDAAEAETVTVHVPNTGPMTGLLDSLPADALLSVAPDGSKRKYAHTLEFLHAEGVWVGTHSAKANAMARQLLEQRLLPQLPAYEAIQPEVQFGDGGKSRVDFVLHAGTAPAAVDGSPRSAAGSKRRRGRGGGVYEADASVTAAAAVSTATVGAAVGGAAASAVAATASTASAAEATAEAAAAAAPPASCFVEVKSVTLAENMPGGAGCIALFPDTVSERAQKHVRELTAIARAGGSAALLFVVQRGDCCAFAPCHEKDAEYGRLVREAAAAGVLILPVVCALDPGAACVRFGGLLPLDLDYKFS